MTLPPVIRIFFAIDLPPSIKEKVSDYMAALKKASKTNGIRWSRPENLHITLQFLATIKTEHLKLLTENVRAKLGNAVLHPQISLGSVHVFPDPYRPRVIVLDVLPQDELAILSRLIGEGIQATHYEIENKPFRAHLTLGRIKQPHGMSLSFLSDCDVPAMDKIDLGEVVLFRSEPLPEGSKYTPIDRIPLMETEY